MGKAALALGRVPALRTLEVRHPDLRPGRAQRVGDHPRAPAWREGVQGGARAQEHPLPVVLPAHPALVSSDAITGEATTRALIPSIARQSRAPPRAKRDARAPSLIVSPNTSAMRRDSRS
jgi:hypothetical protein